MNKYINVKRSILDVILTIPCYYIFLKFGVLQLNKETSFGTINFIYMITLAILYMFNATTRVLFQYWFIPAKALEQLLWPYSIVVILILSY